jgi:ATPase family associated with various cellular activities (AAA)
MRRGVGDAVTGVLATPGRQSVLPYPDGAGELSAHLLRLNRLLAQAVERFRLTHPGPERAGLNGVAIFDEEIDRFLGSSLAAAPQDRRAARDRRDCELREAASARLEVELPIALLRDRFRLGELELDALLHCIAAELHPGYGRVYGYLNNDLTRQRPSVALIIDVLCDDWRSRMAARRALGVDSSLFRLGLLVRAGAEPQIGADHLTAELAVEPSVLDFLLAEPPHHGAGHEAPPELDDLFLSGDERGAVARAIGYLGGRDLTGDEATVVVVSGAPGVGRASCARAVCGILGLRLDAVGSDPAPASGDLHPRLRAARLAGEVPGIYAPRTTAEEGSGVPALIDAVHAAGGGLAFVFVDADEPPKPAQLGGAPALALHLDTPTASVRARAWRQALGAHWLSCPEAAISLTAAIYPFNVGRIRACAREAALQAELAPEGSAERRVDGPALAAICRGQTHHNLERLAQPLATRHGWADIVLPPDELSRLKEIAAAVRNRDRVMEEWGFGAKALAGPGVNAIFFGPSGTGKTMAASILAGELGMAIYRVDLSRVVSKYIGETERNLEALFDEAKRSFAVLFFDEAEALFGKRSEVKDAHDRYANIEVAYLLQRMERFDGVAILATNLRKHLDSAFLRRLQFAVEFPLPTVADRLRIWRQVWPEAARLSDDVDLEFMADQLELSGGHIRNVALIAAYLAAGESAPISMAHLVAATRRELQKLGRSCAPEQFGRYASLFDFGATT